jgi:hypothetical protein
MKKTAMKFPVLITLDNCVMQPFVRGVMQRKS